MVVAEMDIKSLDTWDRKILRSIHGSVVEQGLWTIRTDQELRELYTDLDIVADIQRRDWNGLGM
jgi:hypothetical protein